MTAKKDTPKNSPDDPKTDATKTGKTAKLKKETVESLTEQTSSEQASDKKAPADQPAARKSSLRLWLAVVLVIAAFAGGLAVWPKYGHVLEGYVPAAWLPGADRANRRMDEIAGALDALVGRLAEVEKSTTVQTVIEDLQTGLAEAAKQISELQARAVVPDDLSEVMAATGQRLDELAASSSAAVAALADKVTAELAAQLATQSVERSDAPVAVVQPAGVSAEQFEKLSLALDQLQAANLELQSRLATAEARLAAAAATSGGNNAAAVLVAATGQLRTRAERGAPFAADLDAVRSLLGNADAEVDAEVSVALAGIAAHAADGVPTPEMLAHRFSLIAADLVKHSAPEQAGWAARLWSRAAGLVSVRRTGDVAGNDDEARVARAEAALGRGDVAAAIAEVSALSGPAAAKASSWLAEARAQRAVDEALAVVSRHAIQQMTAAQ